MDIDRKKCRRDANYECECACRLQSDRLAICMEEDETRAFSSARLTRICGRPLPRDGCIARRSSRAPFSFVAQSMELNCQRERTAVFRGFLYARPPRSASAMASGMSESGQATERRSFPAQTHGCCCTFALLRPHHFSSLKGTGTAFIALCRCS